MTQAPLLHRAKQGDAAAIATLINRHATSLGVVAHVNLQQHCLHIILEGQEPPPRLFWSHYLKRSLNRLGATSVAQLRLYGRAHGAKRSAWSETIDLPIDGSPDIPPPPFQGVNVPAAHAACLPDAVPHTARHRGRNQYRVSAASPMKQRYPTQRVAHTPLAPPTWPFWASFQRDWSRVDFALAIQWWVATVLVGVGAIALYHWGQSIALLTGVISQLPKTELILVCVGCWGWL
ncbi:MAG: hypothetical protein WBA10_19830, partial [Elainellaceae cyanobacterium]